MDDSMREMLDERYEAMVASWPEIPKHPSSRIRAEIGLSFDDVLLVPKHGILKKREWADLSSEVVPGWELQIPIISAPMDSVTESKMANAMFKAGGMGVLHRNYDGGFAKQYDDLRNCYVHRDIVVGVALGLKDGIDVAKATVTYCSPPPIFFLDVAHGDHEQVVDFVRRFRAEMEPAGYGYKLIAGNVATGAGAEQLITAGVDGIKVGIGPGAACTTRTVTGVGVPQLTAIMDVRHAIDIYKVRHDFDCTLIADGGIKNSGDIAKALAAGADTVMLGRLLAGANETPMPGHYRGMASRAVNGHRAPEGIDGTVPRTGPVADTLKELAWGLKSTVSYLGATNLKELRENAEFVRTTPQAMIETGTRF